MPKHGRLSVLSSDDPKTPPPDQNISELAQLTRERDAAIARAEAAEAALKQYRQQVTCEWHDLYGSGIYKTTCGRKSDKITEFCPNCGGAVIIKAHHHA